jgi:tetraacyldisaccharide 4'-kinase
MNKKNYSYFPFLNMLLYPLTFLYTQITNFRNYCYDKKLRPSFRFNLPIINVGNLTVGGTGKTPHVEYLIQLLNQKYELATLSRGYGRKTKGFRIANLEDTPQTIGDEPFQIYQKFANQIVVSVGEERILAVPHLLSEKENIQVIILDDAFQHRPIVPSFNILITDYKRLFFNDLPFPSGRLRESRRGAKRADIVIVSKCPSNIQEEEKQNVIKGIKKYSRFDTPIFFTTLNYYSPINYTGKIFDITKPTFLISGIAQPMILEEYAQQKFNITQHFIFPDHYSYKTTDIQNFEKLLHKNPQAQFLTTEKDYTKLSQTSLKENIFVLPITIDFLENKEIFDDLIYKHIQNF